jgi:hypothetical protein
MIFFLFVRGPWPLLAPLVYATSSLSAVAPPIGLGAEGEPTREVVVCREAVTGKKCEVSSTISMCSSGSH